MKHRNEQNNKRTLKCTRNRTKKQIKIRNKSETKQLRSPLVLGSAERNPN